MKSKEENLGGRPPLFDTPETLKEKIAEYFEKGMKKRTVIIGKAPNQMTIKIEVPTITGLCLYLGFESRQSFYAYEKREGFRMILSKARKQINPTSNKPLFNYIDKSQSAKITHRRNCDIGYRIRLNFASLLRYHLKSKNGQKTFDIVDYSVKQLMQHLEKKFKDGMNWSNYGSYWQIDHKIPASSFVYNSYTDDEFKKCWCLNNLQPLTRIENMRKSNRMLK